ncbi:MAG: hypothetical protein K2I96_11510 [Lachnospiraceae bacterium]|nr:hypothetical protein [Lachnospiraceae bacterium]
MKTNEEIFKIEIIRLILNTHDMEDLQKIYSFMKPNIDNEGRDSEEIYYRKSVIEMAIKLPNNLLKRVHRLANYLYVYKMEAEQHEQRGHSA